MWNSMLFFQHVLSVLLSACEKCVCCLEEDSEKVVFIFFPFFFFPLLLVIITGSFLELCID